MNSSKHSIKTTEFFSSTSEAFQGSYSTDPDFLERRALWAGLIGKYSAGRKTALDLGCGPGILTKILLESSLAVLAVDGSDEMVKLCQKNTQASGISRAEYVHDYLPALPKLENRQFELLLCSSVLEYVDDLTGSLGRIHQLLAPGGVAIISMPNRNSFYRKLETAKYMLSGRPAYRAHVKHMLTQKELNEIAGPIGLENRECHFYGNGSGIAARASALLPASLRKNLFLSVFEKKKV